MTRNQIEQELNRLYREQEKAEMANELSACILFNTDSKADALQSISEEIEYYEGLLNEIDKYTHRITNYERTADCPYLAW